MGSEEGITIIISHSNLLWSYKRIKVIIKLVDRKKGFVISVFSKLQRILLIYETSIMLIHYAALGLNTNSSEKLVTYLWKSNSTSYLNCFDAVTTRKSHCIILEVTSQRSINTHTKSESHSTLWGIMHQWTIFQVQNMVAVYFVLIPFGDNINPVIHQGIKRYLQ